MTKYDKATGMTPGIIEYDARSFIVRGKRELLVGGEFHYFRTPRELWEDRIIKMKRSGANLVTTYIAWNWHEPVEGKQRWSGDQDLAHFLELCTKHGMFIAVKPGPYICAEWDFGGHPDWLLSKKIPLRVLDNRYLKYVEKWYKKAPRESTLFVTASVSSTGGRKGGWPNISNQPDCSSRIIVGQSGCPSFARAIPWSKLAISHFQNQGMLG